MPQLQVFLSETDWISVITILEQVKRENDKSGDHELSEEIAEIKTRILQQLIATDDYRD